MLNPAWPDAWHVDEHQFIVHLHDHPDGRLLRVQRLLHGVHAELDQVGGRALPGGVDGSAFGLVRGRSCATVAWVFATCWRQGRCQVKILTASPSAPVQGYATSSPFYVAPKGFIKIN